MAWMMVRVGAEEQAHELDEDLLFIGSDEDVAIRVAGTGVAGKHCQILKTDAGYQLVDLGSPHGTLVNGAKVSGVVLGDGDVLVLGTVTMTFSMTGTTGAAAPAAASPAAAPAAPAPAAPAAPSKGRAGARRRAGSRSAAARSRSSSAAAPARAPAAAAAPAASAARSGSGRRGRGGGDETERGSRSRAYRKEGMSDSAMYAIIGACVVSLGLILYFFLSQERVDWHSQYIEFQDMLDKGQNQQAEARIRYLYENIPEDHTLYGTISNAYTTYGNITAVNQAHQTQQNEASYFAYNVEKYQEEFMLARDKNRNDPALARYFVEYRCNPYLERFPGSPNYEKVKGWAEAAKAKYNASDPYPSKWWEYEVISNMEERRERYGESYRVLSQFLEKNPNHQFAKEAKGKLDDCLRRARNSYWEPYIKKKLDGHFAADPVKYAHALTWTKKAWKNLGDIPEFRQEVSQVIERLRTQARKDHVTIDLSFADMTPAQLRDES